MMFKHWIGVCGLVVALASAQPAEALFLTGVGGFTGNSQFLLGPAGNNGAADGAVNFGVYSTVDANWTNDFGLGGGQPVVYSVGGPGTGNSSSYVYFYQLVNTNPLTTPAEKDLKKLQITLPFDVASITGAGYIGNTVFSDATPGFGGPTGPVGNARLGVGPDTNPPPIPPTDDVPGDGVPSQYYTAAVGPGFVLAVPAIEPSFVDATPGAGGGDPGLLEFSFLPPANFGIGTIPTLAYSTILFITSNAPPLYLRAAVQDTSSTEGDIIAPGEPVGAITPEPGSVVMALGVSICGVVALIACQRRMLLG